MLFTFNRDTSYVILEVGRYRFCRYRYLWPKISVISLSISISFTAVLFGLLTCFIIVHKVPVVS